MEHFVNEGFGWTCRRCLGETRARESNTDLRARFFHEGEAGERAQRLHASALACWRDSSRRALICPRCGVCEPLTRA